MRALRLIAAAILLAWVAGSAPAQVIGGAPLGGWSGGGIAMTLNPDGSYVYRDAAAALAGWWGWQASSATGGVLTLNYATPTVTQTFYNRLYFSVTWIDANDIRLCDPVAHQCVTLARH